MKKELLKTHLGYLSLVTAIVPILISMKSYSVNFGENKPYIFPPLVFLSVILGLISFSKWQGKISVALFFYFAYRLLTDSICVMYA